MIKIEIIEAILKTLFDWVDIILVGIMAGFGVTAGMQFYYYLFY